MVERRVQREPIMMQEVAVSVAKSDVEEIATSGAAGDDARIVGARCFSTHAGNGGSATVTAHGQNHRCASAARSRADR